MPRNYDIKFSIVGDNKYAKALKGITTGLAATASAFIATGTAAFALTTKMTAGQDEAAKFSTRIGKLVEDLSAYQFVADRSGLSTQTFNMAVQRMERRVGEAAKGLGEAKPALAELGIEAEKFAQLPLDDQLTTLSDRMATLESDSDRLRIAFKLFDSEGTAMVQMLSEGSVEMQRLAKRAEFLGLVIDSQAAANATRFQDALTDTQGAVKGLSQAISNEFAPLFTTALEGTADLIARNRERIVAFVMAGVEGVATLGIISIDIFNKIKDGVANGFSIETVRGFAEGATSIIKSFGVNAINVYKALGEFIITVFTSNAKFIRDSAGDVINSIKSIFTKEEVPDLSDALFARATEHFGRVKAGALETVGAISESYKTTFEDVGGTIAEGLGINFKDANARAKAQLANLKSFGIVENKKGLDTQDAQHNAFLSTLNEKYSLFFTQRGTEIQVLADNMLNTMNTVIDGTSEAIGNAIVFSEDLGASLKNVLKQATAQYISMHVQFRLQELTTNALKKLHDSEAMQRFITDTLKKRTTMLKEHVLERAETVKTFAMENAQRAAAFTKFVAVEAAKRAEALATSALYLATLVAQHAKEGLSLALRAAAAAYKSISAIPIVGPGLAPAAAAAALVGVKKLIGQFHDGVDNVPRTGSYMLERGERVISARQNSQIVQALNTTNTTDNSARTVIENVSISIDASGGGLENMDQSELRNLIEDKIIPALDGLDRLGVRQRSITELSTG